MANVHFFILLTYHLTHSNAAGLQWLAWKGFPQAEGLHSPHEVSSPASLLWASLFIFIWFEAFGTCLSLGGTSDWKAVDYPCPFTRLYYRNDWQAGNLMYICYYVMFAGLYLYTETRTGLLGLGS